MSGVAHWDDKVLLQILDRHERQGETYTDIAEAFGTTRSAVAGVIRRIRVDTDLAECAPVEPGKVRAIDPANLDGGMPPLWWSAGLRHPRRRS